MKRLLLIAFCLLLSASFVEAQVNEVRSGAAPPTFCRPARNNIFFHEGVGWKRCTANDTWTLIPLSELVGFTPENSANKVTAFQGTPDNSHYPTEKLVKDSLDLKQNSLGFTPENVANRRTSFQGTPDDTHYPTEKLVKDSLDLKANSAALAAIATSGSASDLLSGALPDARLSANVPRLNSSNTFSLAQTLPLIDKGGQSFNVKGYGAVGNGSTEDTTAFGSALTAAGVACGSVYVPAGTYPVGAITVPACVTVRGPGRSGAVIKRKNSYSGALIDATAGSNAIVDITVDGNHSNNLGNTGAEVVLGSFSFLHNVKLQNSNWMNVQAVGTGIKIDGIEVKGVGSDTLGAPYGVWFDDVNTTLTIANSLFYDLRYGGIFGSGKGSVLAYNLLWNNHLSTSPGGGGQIALKSTGKGVSIIGGWIGPTVGALASGVENDAAGTSIAGLAIDGQPLYGIIFQDGDDGSAVGNTINNSGTAAIRLESAAARNMIAGNSLRGTGATISNASTTTIRGANTDGAFTPASFPNFTTNGFLKTSGGVGSLSVDTTSYRSVLTNSAGLRAALSDEKGTGAALFDSADSPTFLTLTIARADNNNALSLPLKVSNNGAGANAGQGVGISFDAYSTSTELGRISSVIRNTSNAQTDMLFHTYDGATGGLAQRMRIGYDGLITFNTTHYNTCTGLTTAAAVVTCTVSDERVKNSIAAFSDGLSAIRKIQPISFQFNEGTPWFKGRTELGLSAQNLKAANPLLASSTGNDDNLLQPEPMALHAIEIDALKKLDARLTALERENSRRKEARKQR